jgi:Putative prokaryotic signal transducing protein
MDDADLVVVRTFLSYIEAEIAASALEAAGIHVLIKRDDCGGVEPSLWLSGVKLLVRRDDADAAAEALATPASTVTNGEP